MYHSRNFRRNFTGKNSLLYPVLMLLLLFPLFILGQNIDPGSLAVRDSLAHRPVHNTDSLHYTDSVHYHFSYAGTGNINNTNTSSSYVLSNTISFSRVKKSSALSLTNSWVYGSSNGVLSNNDYSAVGDLSLYKTLHHFYYWGLLTYQTSLSLQINNLEQGGFGAGYNLIDQKKAVFIISDGILYERGDLYDIIYGGPGGDVTQRDQYQTVRNSFRIKYHWVIHDFITLDGSDFLQQSFTKSNDYILKFSAAGSIRLYKWINLTAALLYNRFTRTHAENTLVTFGVTINR